VENNKKNIATEQPSSSILTPVQRYDMPYDMKTINKSLQTKLLS